MLILYSTRYVDLMYSSEEDNYHLDTTAHNNTKRIKFGKAISTLVRSKLNISQVLTHSLTYSLTLLADCLFTVLLQENNEFYRVMNENYYDMLTSLNYHTVNFSSLSCSNNDNERCVLLTHSPTH